MAEKSTGSRQHRLPRSKRSRAHRQTSWQGLLPFFESLSYTHRKEYCRRITEAREEKKRSNRLAKAIVRLRGQSKNSGGGEAVRYPRLNFRLR